MCIAASVGMGGQNARDDVRTVQLLLNANHPQVDGPLVANGACGAGTVAAIEQFQHGVIGGGDTPGLVTPASAAVIIPISPRTPDSQLMPLGSTLRALRGGLPPGFSSDKLQGVCIHATTATVSRYFAALLLAMENAAITTPLRQAHFLAQLAHESGEFRYTEELASGTAYEGRKDLGNTQAGDGVRFKGRGLIQLTGRTNYAKFGASLGRDLCTNNAWLQVATDPQLAVGAAIWFWTTRGLNALADADNVLAITKRINGGTNGLPDREVKLARAKWFLLPDNGGGMVTAMKAMALA